MAGIEGKIAQANGRLKSAKVGVTIVQKGDRLALRATLPPKPNSQRTDAYQQRIYTHNRANASGIKLALAETRKIAAK